MARAAPIEDEDWPRTVAAFEEWHALQPERWEFVAGRPRLMAPASMRHSVIKNNFGFALRESLAGSGCTALRHRPSPTSVSPRASAISARPRRSML